MAGILGVFGSSNHGLQLFGLVRCSGDHRADCGHGRRAYLGELDSFSLRSFRLGIDLTSARSA